MAPHLNRIGVVESSYSSSSGSFSTGSNAEALKLKLFFESMSSKDAVSWTCRGEHCRMRTLLLGFSQLLQSSLETVGGLQAHALAIKISGFYDVFVGSSLLNMYCKIGCLLDACKVFDLLLGLL